MEPKNEELEDDVPFQSDEFLGSKILMFQGLVYYHSKQCTVVREIHLISI